MILLPARLPEAEFAQGATALLDSLRSAFLHDEDLEDDLDAVLGAMAGPIGVAGPKHRLKKHGLVLRRWPPVEEIPEPDSAEVLELGRSMTRLDRLLGQLVEIARDRAWPSYPDVTAAVTRAESLRGREPVGEFVADRAHLRLLAMAASELLDHIDDSGGRVVSGPLPRTFWCHADPPLPVLLTDLTVPLPGPAIEWVREAVRSTSVSFDRDTFHAMWAWLGDPTVLRTAVEFLRRGEPYVFYADAPTERWTWTVHRVACLPLANPCGIAPQPTNVRSGAPS
ncbi:DUF6415 family natural product biosynthesis protein [Streptomyces sp. NPDC056161]|uniref:DUF6415 family natural product biosynthesis protein n=1 Tax=Streptomyces sp. NPDC056161 TaxID=3345732 RepID=UPI0035D73DD7